MGNSIVREEMKQKKIDKRFDPRLQYLHSFTKPLPEYCPECGAELEIDEYGETICKDCNLVCSGPIPYVGLKHIDYPYGLRI